MRAPEASADSSWRLPSARNTPSRSRTRLRRSRRTAFSWGFRVLVMEVRVTGPALRGGKLERTPTRPPRAAVGTDARAICARARDDTSARRSRQLQSRSRGVLERAGHVPFRQSAPPAQLLEGLEARQHEEKRERRAIRELRPKASCLTEPREDPLELAAPVARLPLDERRGRRIDGSGPVELPEDRLLGGPEANGIRDQLIQRRVGVLE